jgi:hypothetical protein
MKRNKGIKCLVLVALFGLPLSGTRMVAQEPTLDEQIAASIEGGIGWLVAQQAGDGSWGDDYCDRVAATALVLLKLESNAIEQGMLPLSPDYEYSGNVQDGLDYLVFRSQVQAIGP